VFYLEEVAVRRESIKARLFQTAERFKAGAAEGGGVDWEAAEDRLREIVEQINQKLQPYQRISKVTILRERLAETTKKTVKRFAVAKK
jgi:long-chain acyl-CoA synthetase